MKNKLPTLIKNIQSQVHSYHWAWLIVLCLSITSIWQLHVYLALKQETEIIYKDFVQEYDHLIANQTQNPYAPFYPIKDYIYSDVDQALDYYKKYARVTAHPPYTGHNNFEIKQTEITPARHTPDQGSIALLLVHGTFSSHAQYGGDPERELSKYFYAFAHQLAQATHKKIILLSVQWSGTLKVSDRKDAGIQTAQYVQKILHKHAISNIWAIAHSHGCNVLNNTAQELAKYNHTMDVGIFLGSPSLDYDPFDATGSGKYNIAHVYNFWGGEDFISQLGSIVNLRQPNYYKTYAQSRYETIRNIRMQQNGKPLHHSSITRIVAHYLASLINTIQLQYPLHFDLDINVLEVQAETSLEIAIRKEHFLQEFFVRLPKKYQELIEESRKHSITIKSGYKKRHGFDIDQDPSNPIVSFFKELYTQATQKP